MEDCDDGHSMQRPETCSRYSVSASLATYLVGVSNAASSQEGVQHSAGWPAGNGFTKQGGRKSFNMR